MKRISFALILIGSFLILYSKDMLHFSWLTLTTDRLLSPYNLARPNYMANETCPSANVNVASASHDKMNSKDDTQYKVDGNQTEATTAESTAASVYEEDTSSEKSNVIVGAINLPVAEVIDSTLVGNSISADNKFIVKEKPVVLEEKIVTNTSKPAEAVAKINVAYAAKTEAVDESQFPQVKAPTFEKKLVEEAKPPIDKAANNAPSTTTTTTTYNNVEPTIATGNRKVSDKIDLDERARKKKEELEKAAKERSERDAKFKKDKEEREAQRLKTKKDKEEKDAIRLKNKAEQEAKLKELRERKKPKV